MVLLLLLLLVSTIAPAPARAEDPPRLLVVVGDVGPGAAPSEHPPGPVTAHAIGGRWAGKWQTDDACGAKLRAGMEGPLLHLAEGLVGRYWVDRVRPPSTDPPDEGTVCAEGRATALPGKKLRYPLLAVLGAKDAGRVAWTVQSYPLTHATYRAAARQWLRSKGVSATAAEGAHLRQLLGTDLERDGRREVLFAAAATAGDYLFRLHEPGGFWGLALRFLPQGSSTARTLPLFLQIRRDPGTMPETFLVAGVLDVDGDGVAEVLTRGEYYEGWSYALWRWDGKRLVALSSWGAGA